MDNYRVVYTLGGQFCVYATRDTKSEILEALREAQAEEVPNVKAQELADMWGELEWVDIRG